MRRTPRSHDGSQARDASCPRLGHRAKVCPRLRFPPWWGQTGAVSLATVCAPHEPRPRPSPLGTGARAWSLRRNRRHAKYHPAREPQQQFPAARPAEPHDRPVHEGHSRATPARQPPRGPGGCALHSATQHTSPHRMCARTPGREAHCTNWCTGAGTHPPRDRRMHRSGPSGNRLTDRTGAHPSVRPVVLPRPTGHRRPPLHRRGGRSLSCPARALPLATFLATRVRLLCWRSPQATKEAATARRWSNDEPALTQRFRWSEPVLSVGLTGFEPATPCPSTRPPVQPSPICGNTL